MASNCITGKTNTCRAGILSQLFLGLKCSVPISYIEYRNTLLRDAAQEAVEVRDEFPAMLIIRRIELGKLEHEHAVSHISAYVLLPS